MNVIKVKKDSSVDVINKYQSSLYPYIACFEHVTNRISVLVSSGGSAEGECHWVDIKNIRIPLTESFESFYDAIDPLLNDEERYSVVVFKDITELSDYIKQYFSNLL